jgi:hypothetical protein
MKSFIDVTRGAVFAVLFLEGAVSFAAPAPPPTLDPTDFTQPVANQYFPLVSGTTFSYETQTDDGLVRTETTVTSQTRTIQTVKAIVVHDVVWLDRNGTTYLLENTQDWYAPDNFGNVWYLGESTVAYLFDDNWNPIGTSTEGSWEAGVNDAAAGIIMPADPKPGLAYRQEFAAGVAEDMAKVQSLNAKVSVPYGDFSDVLVTKEWTPLEPGSVEQKYYAAGVGLVLVKELKGKGTVREELVGISP